MKIIESIRPFKINDKIKRIILKLSIIPITWNATYTYLIWNNPNDYQKYLEILKELKYIHSYNDMIYLWDYKYKERWWFSPIKMDNIKDLFINPDDKVLFKIYFNNNQEKWNYITNLSSNLNINFDIDLEKINTILIWYDNNDFDIIKLLKEIQFKYSIFFPDNDKLDKNSLQDFLYFFAYNDSVEFSRLSLSMNNIIDFNEENWDVFLNNKLIWNIPCNNREYKFFQFLFINKWTYKSHGDIMDYVTWYEQKSKRAQSFCSDIKRLLKKDIKDLIQSWKWEYRIP